jgi:hypothetical protein
MATLPSDGAGLSVDAAPALGGSASPSLCGASFLAFKRGVRIPDAAEIQRSLTGSPSGVELRRMRAHAPQPTITTSLPSGSATRQRSSRLVKEPTAGCGARGEARLREVRRHGELEVDAVALPTPLRL